MKILYFTNPDIKDPNVIPDILRLAGDEVLCTYQKISIEWILDNKIEFIVSDRSRSLINKEVIEYLNRKIVNLHPSFLPWNKGYHPNYWSIKEGTPFGVTLHYIDEGIDTGNILAQTRLFYSDEDTLRTTYERLRFAMVELFRIYWPLIKCGNLPDSPQIQSEGSFHYKKDFDGVMPTLEEGWDTKVKNINSLYKLVT